jgi:flagellar biosynthetic protein FlhB
MLYYNVKVGDEIPRELFEAVAAALAYVYDVKNIKAV